MTILSIFNTGGLTLGITIVFIILMAIFGYQLYRQTRPGGVTQDLQKGPQYDNDPNPFYRQNTFYFMMAVLVAYIVALLIIRSDYRPYDPKKDGVPREQTDTTRVPAEDMVKPDTVPAGK